jgi:hypothetical protein
MARTHLEQRCGLLEKLAELTPKMRAAQVNYFKTRDKSYMREAVELEGRVDEICVRLAQNKLYCAGELPNQAQLFS